MLYHYTVYVFVTSDQFHASLLSKIVKNLHDSSLLTGSVFLLFLVLFIFNLIKMIVYELLLIISFIHRHTQETVQLFFRVRLPVLSPTLHGL